MKEERTGAAIYRVFTIIGIALMAISMAVSRGFVGVGGLFFIIGLAGMINKGVEQATASPPAADGEDETP